MKTRLILLATAITALSFASCSNDDNKHENYDGPVLFHSTIKAIDGTVTTKATNASWDDKDAIGVFMKTGTGLTNIIDNAENKKYTTTGDGKFSPAVKLDDAIYFPENGSAVDFIAYYPYIKPLTNNIYKVELATQTSQPAIDLLYSNDAAGLTASSTVAMGFVHKLTKLEFNIKADSNVPTLENISVVINGANTKADFDLATGVLSVESAPAAITAKSTVTSGTAKAEAIILPWAATAERSIVFTVPSGSFKWEIPEDRVYEQGKKYTFDILLKDGGKVEITATGTITDWGVGGNEEIEIGGEATENDGTQAKPYTIAEALTKVGETGKWTTGYIVGSTVKTKSFGPDVNTNILLAASATETDEAKCIIVNLDGSAVQANLDIAANPTLKGTKVKVLGDIVNNIFGNTISMTNVTAQEGGIVIGTPVTTEFFKETFGNGDYPASNRPKISAFTDFDMKSVTYTDAYNTADIRSTTTINASIWFPTSTTSNPTNESSLKIENIDGTYKDVTLSYDIAANLGAGVATNGNVLVVRVNGVEITTIPSTPLERTNVYSTISFTIPDGTTTIEFYSHSDSNKTGLRLDNIALTGTK